MTMQGASRRGRADEPARPRVSRRAFMGGALGTAVLAGLGALGGAGVGAASGDDAALRPPGAQDEARFLSRCVHCEKCREICPQGVLRTLGTEGGIAAMRTPTMDFRRGWCNACEDTDGAEPLCARVCPTRAIEVPAGVAARDVVIGVARINRDWCLAWQNKSCKVCVEECPYEGVVFDKDKRPVVQTEKCNGCGLCEHVCISLTSASVAPDATDRAIVVVPDPDRQEVLA